MKVALKVRVEMIQPVEQSVDRIAIKAPFMVIPGIPTLLLPLHPFPWQSPFELKGTVRAEMAQKGNKCLWFPARDAWMMAHILRLAGYDVDAYGDDDFASGDQFFSPNYGHFTWPLLLDIKGGDPRIRLSNQRERKMVLTKLPHMLGHIFDKQRLIYEIRVISRGVSESHKNNMTPIMGEAEPGIIDDVPYVLHFAASNVLQSVPAWTQRLPAVFRFAPVVKDGGTSGRALTIDVSDADDPCTLHGIKLRARSMEIELHSSTPQQSEQDLITVAPSEPSGAPFTGGVLIEDVTEQEIETGKNGPLMITWEGETVLEEVENTDTERGSSGSSPVSTSPPTPAEKDNEGSPETGQRRGTHQLSREEKGKGPATKTVSPQPPQQDSLRRLGPPSEHRPRISVRTVTVPSPVTPQSIRSASIRPSVRYRPPIPPPQPTRTSRHTPIFGSGRGTALNVPRGSAPIRVVRNLGRVGPTNSPLPRSRSGSRSDQGGSL
nr:putative capsid protein [Poaceae Liege totivirus 5]